MSFIDARRTIGLLVVAVGALLLSPSTEAQWAADPGETKRNAFGPLRGDKASICRGACGAGCPDSCESDVFFECTGSTQLRRVETLQCGTHRGCREHDDCLDACAERGTDQLECKSSCHQEAVESFGFTDATSWASGGGPYDGPPIVFEYTLDTPGANEAAYRCPEGARRTCGDSAGRCLTADGEPTEPIFDGYPSAAAGAMRIADFRSGKLCGFQVCEQSSEIQVTGKDDCTRDGRQTPCTRYGVEFDYRSADPSAPLECSTVTTGGERDFIGDLVVKGLEAMPERENVEGEEEEDGMRALMGMFKKVVESADRPEDVRISMAPLGEDGKPDESRRVGSSPDAGPPSTPRIVKINAPSGHLVVPMYEFAGEPGAKPMEREIRCSHKGVPVFEATFHLTF